MDDRCPTCGTWNVSQYGIAPDGAIYKDGALLVPGNPAPQPPPVCTGSGHLSYPPDRCGICGQVVALDGQGRTVTHAYVAAPPAGETKP